MRGRAFLDRVLAELRVLGEGAGEVERALAAALHITRRAATSGRGAQSRIESSTRRASATSLPR
jgi:hypothetical protein